MSNTLEQVRVIISNTFAVALEDVTEGSSNETLENWDSMRHLMLILELEQEFDRQFSPEQVEQMTSVKAIVTLLNMPQS